MVRAVSRILLLLSARADSRLSLSLWLQSNALRPYLSAVRSTLTAALTLENFGSQVSLPLAHLSDLEAATDIVLSLSAAGRRATQRP